MWLETKCGVRVGVGLLCCYETIITSDLLSLIIWWHPSSLKEDRAGTLELLNFGYELTFSGDEIAEKGRYFPKIRFWEY